MADESAALRSALDEGNTVFLIFGNQPGVTEEDMRVAFDQATLVATAFSPATWRTFLVEDPSNLDPNLKDFIWPAGDTSPAVLLSLGTGMVRNRIGGFQLTDFLDNFAIAQVFSQG